MEQEIFLRSKIDFSKLVSFGFKKINKEYKITKYILNKQFKIEVIISLDENISVHIYDEKLQEEYLNYRIKDYNGSFVNKVREELRLFLESIKDNCCENKYFRSNQANRITNLIYELYHDLPQFLWKDSPHGVFKNPCNQKWYGIIMNIEQKKIRNKKGNVEVLNVKLAKDKIPLLLKKKGYYTAYQMNKANWLTIILDETLKDEEIMALIAESHQFTLKKEE